MKQIYLFFSFFLFLGMTSCLEDPVMNTKLQNAEKPIISDAAQIGDPEATFLKAKAKVESENGAPVTERGFIYRPKGANKQEEKKCVDEGQGTGEYEREIKDLLPDTTYLVVSYAINVVDTAFGKEIPFSTIAGTGIVSTIKTDSVRATSAIFRGEIKSKGKDDPEEWGFYLYESDNFHVPDSTIRFNKTNAIAPKDTFLMKYNHLKPNKEYFVKAYYKNSFGTVEGCIDTLITSSGLPQIGSIMRDGEPDYTQVPLKSVLLSEGDSVIKAAGFCWGTNDTPTIEGDTAVCQVDERGEFKGAMTNLVAATKYYARSFATNAFGTVYSPEILTIFPKSKLPTIVLNEEFILEDGTIKISGELQNQGMTPVVSLGVCFSSKTQKPTYTNNEGRVDLTVKNLDENGRFEMEFKLRGGVKYYIQAYAMNGEGTENDTKYSDIVLSVTVPNIFQSQNIFTGSERVRFASFTLNDQAFIVGGDMGMESTDELYGYSAISNAWKLFEPYPIKATSMATTSKENTAYSFGGRSGSQIQGKCYSYTDNMWKELASLVKGNLRYDAISFVYRDSIYLVGGKVDTRTKAETDTICSYDIVTDKWKATGKFPVEISNGIAVTVDDVVFVGLGDSKSDLWYSSGKLTSWTKARGTFPSQMEAVSTGVVYNSSLYVIDMAGWVWQYSFVVGEWSRKSRFPASYITTYKMFILNNKIYILGVENFTKALFTYDPVWDN